MTKKAKKKEIVVYFNRQRVVAPKKRMTEAELRGLFQVPYPTNRLYKETPGQASMDVLVKPGATVVLETGDRFYDLPPGTVGRLERRAVSNRRVQIGVVRVDSGQLLLCDPCYRQPENPRFRELNDSEMFGKRTWTGLHHQLRFDDGHAGLGIVFESGYGDGLYAVYATIDRGIGGQMRIKKVEIELITGGEQPSPGRKLPDICACGLAE